MLEIDEYRKVLGRLAKKASGEYIDNSSRAYASAMIEALFNEAKGKACILCDHLDPLIYGKTDVMEAALDFIQKEGNRLIIILQFNQLGEDSLSRNVFLSYLGDYMDADKVSIYRANKLIKEIKNHFMVVKTGKGDNAMRYELDTKERRATGSFNVGAFGDSLFNFFEKAQVLLKMEGKEITLKTPVAPVRL